MRLHPIKPLFWLFITPLLVPLLFLAVKRWQKNQVSLYGAGGHKTEVAGERAALKVLDRAATNSRIQGLIRVNWDVVKPALKPTSKRPKEIWLYGLFYDQQDQRLIHYTLSPHFTDVQQAYAVQYNSVTNEVIRATADSNGIMSDLVKHGATLVRRGDAKADDKQGLIFQ